MTKAEQVRLVTWRSKILQHASGENRTVSQTCRFFGISRKTYYKWANRQRTYGDAGLSDRARVALRFPRATPPEVVSKILFYASGITSAPAGSPTTFGAFTTSP
jgi:hypothetical protein